MSRTSIRRPLALLGALIFALTLVAGPRTAAPVQAASDRPVMAFYYPWYEKSDWSYDRMSDVPAPTYSGGDDSAIRRHIQQADDAGVDALICTWYGPKEDRLDKRCRRLLQLVQASGRKIRVAIIPDQSAAFDSGMRTVEGLASALDVLRRDFTGSPAYFTFQGKPVVFWFNPPSLGDVGAWGRLRDRADPGRDQFWFGGTDNFGYLDVYDALYYFDISWETAPGRAMASYAGRLDRYNRDHPGANKPFIATTMPGYDDIKIRNGHRKDRANGDYYRGTWQTAIDRSAAAVVLTSFNEFYEGSYIEPSEQYGDLYLRLTKEWSDKYHNGQATAPQQLGGPCRQFPETGHQVCGRILEYWDQNGGLPVFGYPIGELTAQQIEGKTFQVQWFERNRLELHPENTRPYDVLLGRLGFDSLVKQGRDWHTFGTVEPSTPHYFPETGHAIAAQFWDDWSSHGLEFDGQAGKRFNESLALFGLPLSEAVMEQSATDGTTYLTQHFERARLEFHPENAGTPYEVLLGLLGAELSGPATPSVPSAFAMQVIDLVNHERAKARCPALILNEVLAHVAQAHAQDMADHDFFDHTGSDGRSTFQRLRDAGYNYRLAAENIAAGVATPAEVVALWMDSPSHRANILNCALRETGVGYVADPNDRLNYGTYWVQTFGTR